MGVLRFYLALSVVAWHSDPTWLPLIPGTWAVGRFFVISGFYMSLALTSKYSDARTFWLNRILRLYPTYLLFVLAYWAWYFFIWAWLHKPPMGGDWQAKYAAMTWWQSAPLVISNWTMVGQDIVNLVDFRPGVGFVLIDPPSTLLTIGPAWSLGSELWFYLLVPAMVRLKSSLLIAVAVLSAVTFAATAFVSIDLARFSPFPTNLVFFIVGMLLHRHSSLALHLFKRTSTIPWDRTIGNLSYPIYVSHWIIASIAANVLHFRPFLVIATATLAISVLVYQLVERPIDIWRSTMLLRHANRAIA